MNTAPSLKARFAVGDRVQIVIGFNRGCHGTVMRCFGEQPNCYDVRMKSNSLIIGYSEHELEASR